MSGAPTSGAPGGLRERAPASRSAEGARGAGKPGAARPENGSEDKPGAADFTAALVVAGSVAPPMPPPVPATAAPEVPEEPPSAAPARSRSDADRSHPDAKRAALELKLPDDALADRHAVPAGDRSGSAETRAGGPALPPPPAADDRGPAARPSPPPPPPVLDDRNLAGTVHPRAAHLSLDAGRSNEIGLHLRVRDGVADVRIDGSVAPLLLARSAELRLALVREGLQLGSLELSTGAGDPSRQGPADRPEAPGAVAGAPAPAPAAAGPPASPHRVADAAPGRVHVKA